MSPRSGHAVGWCVLPLLVACGGNGVATGTGGASPAAGGTEAASGGTSSASGGTSPVGGAPASGGTPASGGMGGYVEESGWDEVRCFQYEEQEGRTCFGRMGNLWATLAAMCAFTSEAKDPMDLNQELCHAEDDAAEWDETWCGEDYCYGRLGDWATVLEVECNLYPYPHTDLDGTPSELYCDLTETPAGWQDVHCLVSDGQIEDTYCFGARGVYYAKWGLVPACWIEDYYVGNQRYMEVTPDPTYCP